MNNERRDELLAKAKAAFVRFGYRKTTLSDVAQDAGLERASVYYYFKNKKDLFTAVVEAEGESRLRALQATAICETSAEKKILAVVREFVRGERALLELVAGTGENVLQLIPRSIGTFRSVKERWLDLLEEILNLGVESGELNVPNPRELARGIQAVLLGSTLPSVLNIIDPVDPEFKEIDVVIDAILRGIRTKPSDMTGRQK